MVALLAVMRSKSLVLITWTLLGAAAAGVINLLLPVVYEATAKIVIATPYWNDSTAIVPDPSYTGKTTQGYGDEFTQQRMASYARLVTTPLVTDRVNERLRLGKSGEDLAKKLSGHIVPDTVILQVRAQDASPVRAATIADATAQQTVDVIKEIERPPYTLVSPVQPVLTAPASVPSRPISPRTLQNIACGALVGFLLGLTWLAVYAAPRDNPVLARFRGDGTRTGELAGVLGVLTAEDQLTLDEAKLLRLEIAHRLTEAEVESFAVTSPRATPATSVVAALLATALTEAGSPSVVVCADFTTGQDDSTVGLGDLLCTSLALDSAIQSDEQRGISWIPAGMAPANPTRELTGSKMRDLLIDLSRRYRHVIVVGPAVLESADAVDVASQVGASILVDLAPETTPAELRESERLLGLARGTCLGRVIVAGQAFAKHVELPQFDRPTSSRMSQSNTASGEQWSY
jgi:capsular polysaccharide biosynthesis protein/Mrp family chromosome partitioning ATPase